MEALKALAEELPDAAKDIRLNLQSVLSDTSLTPSQRWGVAAACAIAARSPRLEEAVLQGAAAGADDAVLDDARAAAALMAMNNVFYRFRHMVGKPSYTTIPPRLRMNRIGAPRTSKSDFELMCLAVSALFGCETCVRSHERTVLEAGATEQNVHDAVRIAAAVHGAAVALGARAGL
jgi:alkyl hydroperoxide reductase subunit D